MRLVFFFIFLFVFLLSKSEVKELQIMKSEIKTIKKIEENLLMIVSNDGKVKGFNRKFRIQLFDENLKNVFSSNFTFSHDCYYKECVKVFDGYLFHFIDKKRKKSYAIRYKKNGEILNDKIIDRSKIDNGEYYFPTYFSDKNGNLYAFQNVKIKDYKGFKVSKFDSDFEEFWKTYIEKGNIGVFEGMLTKSSLENLYLFYVNQGTQLKLSSIDLINGEIISTIKFPENISTMSGYDFYVENGFLNVSGFSLGDFFLKKFDKNLEEINSVIFPFKEDEDLNKLRNSHFYCSSVTKGDEKIFIIERIAYPVSVLGVASLATGAVSMAMGGFGRISDPSKLVVKEIFIFKYNESGELDSYKKIEKKNGNPERNFTFLYDFDRVIYSDFRYYDFENDCLGITTYDVGNKVHKIFFYETGKTKTYNIPGSGKVNDVYRLGNKSIMIYNENGIKLRVLN